MKLLVDMNLSPTWVDTLRGAGWECAHWSSLGPPDAPDKVLFAFAREHGWVIFTHDLDFGTMLAHSRAGAPSVFQVRTQALVPQKLGSLVVQTLKTFATELEAGALVTLDEQRQRVRLLPLQ